MLGMYGKKASMERQISNGLIKNFKRECQSENVSKPFAVKQDTVQKKQKMSEGKKEILLGDCLDLMKTIDDNSIYKTLSASNHTDKERQNEDYYATDPKAADLLLELETFSPNIWECACGEGHLSKVFEKAGHIVKSTDLMDRGFGETGIDFLSIDNLEWNGDIITNPPYKYAQEFIEKALHIVTGKQGSNVFEDTIFGR